MLNRTIRLARRPADAGPPDSNNVQELVDSEEFVAELTRTLAEGLEERGNFRCELLYDAEKTMLTAKQSLSDHAFPKATEEEKQALVFLIKARDKLRQVLPKSSPAALAALRKFDRTQAQKLRRPKDEAEEAEQLAARLRQLAQQEELVYATIASLTPPDENAPQQPPPTDSESQGGSQANTEPGEKEQPQSEDRADSQTGQTPRQPGADRGETPGQTPAQTPGQTPGQTSGQTPGQTGETGASEQSPSGERSPQDTGAGSEAQRPSSAEPDGGREEGPQGGPTPGDMERRELELLQRAIADEAYDIQRVMEGIDRLTELAQTRMQRAAGKAEQASGALARGATDEAREASREAGAMFGELAEHVEGLLGPEPAQRIAAARDLASQLAQLQRQLAGALAGSDPSAAAESSAPTGNRQPATQGRGPGAGGQRGDHQTAARLAQRGRTLEDVLRALTKFDDQARAELSRRVGQLVDEGKVTQTVKQMQAVERIARAGQWGQLRSETDEIARRLELLAGRLDALHRSVVAPRLEALIALEKRAAALQTKLATLDSQEAITRWHHDSAALSDDLVDQSAGSNELRAAGADLLDAMHGEGWADGYHVWDWELAGGGSYFAGPASYDRYLTEIVQQLQDQARELLLGDLISAEDEAVPPQYEQFVRRYFQVLSSTATQPRSAIQREAAGSHDRGN